jgi:hypothetical protein
MRRGACVKECLVDNFDDDEQFYLTPHVSKNARWEEIEKEERG